MHTSVQQISISGSCYFLQLDWNGPDLGSGFRLLLTDAQEAWRGEVSHAAICEEAKELEMENDKFVQNVQQALTQTERSKSYSFSFSGSGAHMSLAYEKVQKDITFRLGSITLTALSDPAEAMRDLLLYSMDKGNSLHRYNHKLEEQNQWLKQEHHRITTQLKRYASSKEALELELYSRFILVLNEKKAKIRNLNQTLESLQDERSSYGKTDRSRCENNEKDEYGGSTEGETEEAEPKPAEKKPESETNECTIASPLDDSLCDLLDVAPCRKRRFRHLEVPIRTFKPHSSKKRRSASPAALSVEQAPHRSTDAAATTSDAEDLFEDI